ncbi:MAG: hypothetical protein WBG66_17595 [Geitlerinemataceae cyanobacterium]
MSSPVSHTFSRSIFFLWNSIFPGGAIVVLKTIINGRSSDRADRRLTQYLDLNMIQHSHGSCRQIGRFCKHPKSQKAAVEG